MFADIYGTLCCGSGFARALMALLADHPREVANEVRSEADWGSYPTRTLRVLLAAAVLTRLKVEPADESVAEAWLRTYAARPLREYECDAGPVAAAVLDGPYEALDGPDKAPGGKSLTVIVRYTNDDEQTVSRLARRLVKGRAIDARAASATSPPPSGWPMTVTGGVRGKQRGQDLARQDRELPLGRLPPEGRPGHPARVRALGT